MSQQSCLEFGPHPDVVFRKAPLASVLCQVRFPKILALLDDAGIAGLQEALRREYPVNATEREMQFAIDSNQSEMQLRQFAPVYRMKSEDDQWTVSAAVDFVSLETPNYPYYGEFGRRLDFLLAAVDRTLKPGRSSRIGLRKVNVIRHPEVTIHGEWIRFLKPAFLGLLADDTLPGHVRSSYAEWSIADEDQGTLTVRFGMDPEVPEAFRLDLDYWTERHLKVAGGGTMTDVIAAYAAACTAFFHWAIQPNLYEYLEPVDRSQVEGM